MNTSSVRLTLLLTAFAAAIPSALAQYKLPPSEITEIVDAPAPPMAIVSPAGNGILFYETAPQPSLATVSRRYVPLAGIRIDPELRMERRLTESRGVTLQTLPAGKPVRLRLPEDGRLGMPRWSDDGKRFFLLHAREGGSEIWAGEAATGEVRMVKGVRVSETVMDGASWLSDNRTLLVAMVPPGIGSVPPKPLVPETPNMEESSGRKTQVATFQDLLRTSYDTKLFAYFATSQPAFVDVRTGRITKLGPPDFYIDIDESPNGNFLLVTRLRQPFSLLVPYDGFARTTEVWDRSGKKIAVVADLPVEDEVPRQGVPTGPRRIEWQPRQPATLLWVEALDGGDPMTKAPHRDRLMRFRAPFAGTPEEVVKIQHRYAGFSWLSAPDRALLTQTDRDRRWRTTTLVDLASASPIGVTMFDLSINDAYKDPGTPLTEVLPGGDRVVVQEGEWIYLQSRGMSERGARPALVRWNLRTRERDSVFVSGEKEFAQFIQFCDPGKKTYLLRRESPVDPPNYYLCDRASGTRRQLTDVRDPAPQLTGIERRVMTYSRADGVPLSGTLYLPPGYTPGKRIPALIWAYPMEYSDAATAGQVRATPTRFTYFRGTSPLFFLLRGYAVLMDATMPVVGNPETMNDTFVEQIVGAAKGAIDLLDSLGVVDRTKVIVSGHSYGAFMTANLLAHSDLFAAGIARSGAYNRTLTPFGFQSERRSFWEAPDVYLKVSPFSHANKINEPLLLIHGEADNNPGTFPIQSERLYQAVRGHGGTVRLVLLPNESHGYSGRESVLHVLAEMFEWADRFVTNAR